MEFDRWDIEIWAARSRKGEVCGIFGCPGKPVKQCRHCGNWYCNEHKEVINLPSHSSEENHDSRASHDIRENQITRASHSTKGNQGIRASHDS